MAVRILTLPIGTANPSRVFGLPCGTRNPSTFFRIGSGTVPLDTEVEAKGAEGKLGEDTAEEVDEEAKVSLGLVGRRSEVLLLC